MSYVPMITVQSLQFNIRKLLLFPNYFSNEFQSLHDLSNPRLIHQLLELNLRIVPATSHLILNHHNAISFVLLSIPTIFLSFYSLFLYSKITTRYYTVLIIISLGFKI